MKSVYALFVICLATIGSIGCRQKPYMNVYVESINAEKRMLEDRLYELEAANEKARREIERLQAEGGTGSSGTGSGSSSSGRLPEPDVPRIQIGDPPDGGDDEDDDIPDLDISPPTIDPGDPQGRRQQPTERSARTANAHQTVSVRQERVVNLRINPLLTQGANLDDQPGDEGLRLVLEPRNQRGETVMVPGHVLVELVDPAANDESLALWEFSEKETQLAFHRAEQGQGIRLQMRLPNEPREHSRLQVRVKFRAAQGQQLSAHHDITLAREGESTARWTPRSDDTILDAPANVSGPEINQPQVVSPEEGSSESPRQAQRPNEPPPESPEWRPYR